MHCEKGCSHINSIHAIFGKILRHSSTSPLVDFTQFSCLPDYAFLEKKTPDLSYILCMGIVGPYLAHMARKLGYANAAPEVAGVLLLMHVLPIGIDCSVDIGAD